MQHARPRLLLRSGTALAVAALLTAGCSRSDEVDEVDAAAATSSQAAALSSAAQASPGDYGSPVDPALPNPTDVATDAPAATPSSAAAGTVSVVITYAGWIDTEGAVEVGALVPGVAESGGTCTLTLTGSGRPVTATADAEADVDSTSCPTMSVPGSDLPSGTYDAVVDYRSPARTGSSAATSVVVP